MANYVTEDSKRYLMEVDDCTDNTLIKLYAGIENPESLGKLYMIYQKNSFNPVAVAAVNGNNFSIFTEKSRIDISGKEANSEFSLASILSVYSIIAKL